MALIPWKENELMGWKSFQRDLSRLREEMDSLFEGNFPSFKIPKNLEAVWSPAVDVVDGKDSVVIKADLPGVDKDKIEVNVEDGMLTIKGEKKEEKEVKEKGYVRTERFQGSFYRALSLPAAVKKDQIKAEYHNGVLEVTVPKAEEAKPKQVKVEVK